VLHVIPTLDHRSGGPSLALAGLALAQRRAGLDVTLAVQRFDPADPALVARARAGGVRVLEARSAEPLVLAAEVQGAAVCHIHALWEPIQHRAAVLCRRAGRPHIFRPCGMLDPWSLARKRWKKRLYLAWRLRRDLDGCSALHFTTALERDLTRPLRLRAPAIVECNGVDLEEFRAPPPVGSFRARHGIPAGRRVVLFMSRLHPKKGLDLLIRAFARLDPSSTWLVIAGPDEGGHREAIARLARDCGIEDRLSMCPMLRDGERVAALADADLFALPSRQENFGVVVVEALAAGTPVVVSDQVNLHPEISAAGAGGVVRLDVDALARELRAWLEDEPRRRAASERGRALVAERFDWRRIAERWAVRYRDLASGRLPADAIGT
jgi:glycosyltransferase involved in cell wall biosynthesis